MRLYRLLLLAIGKKRKDGEDQNGSHYHQTEREVNVQPGEDGEGSGEIDLACCKQGIASIPKNASRSSRNENTPNPEKETPKHSKNMNNAVSKSCPYSCWMLRL